MIEAREILDTFDLRANLSCILVEPIYHPLGALDWDELLQDMNIAHWYDISEHFNTTLVRAREEF